MNLHGLTSKLETLELRSCLIQQQGSLVYEQYKDRHTAYEIFRINSCTKSILSALICIAMDQGKLPGPQTPASLFFPQLSRDKDERKQRITIGHLLTMSAGFRWNEFGGLNSFPQMTRSPDWAEYVLKQPLADEPGIRMEYNSGISQLLSAILVQATGIPTAQFAEQVLFGPLGITEYEWEADPQGIHTGGFGLKLMPADLLKFGQLYLQEGKWENTQVISSGLVASSALPALRSEPPRQGGYGWHWWTDTLPAGTGPERSEGMPYYYARGYAGQFVYVLPQLEVVVVLTRDNKRGRNNPAPDAFHEHIAPLLLASDRPKRA
ncbi:serine hydrolase [Paenibacillus sp. MMS20-IR301]|uniref:serine hydrolase domain-containing protein n=1 Tax=Paenibacillus sp. MMS20-IR301 TaxID=2895946 RepID=UPI0028F12675|nr:serine hydrolase [Paenibacillus sp. MMS20-IR301]WNS44636.1 serine hydrolase [Paenibacillus sp. MMS20-IR301]